MVMIHSVCYWCRQLLKYWWSECKSLTHNAYSNTANICNKTIYQFKHANMYLCQLAFNSSLKLIVVPCNYVCQKPEMSAGNQSLQVLETFNFSCQCPAIVCARNMQFLVLVPVNYSCRKVQIIHIGMQQ